jgi:hypothetical protein
MASESTSASDKRNLLVNPSFDQGGSAPHGWRFDGPAQHARASWTRDGAHCGDRCLAFFPQMQAAAWESDAVPLVAGKPYGLLWWTRFQGGEPWHWSYHSEFVGVIVRFLDGGGHEVGSQRRKFHCLATADWQQAWIKFTPPHGCDKATVAFVYRTGIETDGHMWVDDVALEGLDPLPPVPDGGARVTLRVADESGKPLTARMWARTAAGEYLFPKYSYRFRVPDIGFHAAPEDCWIDAPPGTVIVGARRGFEYAPVEEAVRVNAGETRAVHLVLRRTADMPASGWFAGDHHSHLFFHKHTQHPQMRPQDSFEIAKAEGLNYLSLDGEMIEFRANLGDKEKARDEKFVGEIGLEAVTDFYGHLCLINVRRDMPGGFPMRTVYWPTNEMVQQYAVEQGAAVIAAHPLNTLDLERFFEVVADPQRGCLARELAVDVLLGRRVSFDIFSESSPPQGASDMVETYYHLLNLGRRVGVTASTDYYVDQGQGACGAWRTYARAGRLDFAAIAEAYREGRTFATNGPLVLLRIGGAEPGSDVGLAKPGEVEVSLRAQSQWGVSAAELVINGAVARRWDATDGALDIADTVRIDQTSWAAARVFGPKSPQVDSSPIAEAADDGSHGLSFGQFAHTSPAYLRVGKADFRPRRDAVEFCLTWVVAMAAAVAKAQDKYHAADLAAYGISGIEALERVLERLNEAMEVGHRLLRGAV